GGSLAVRDHSRPRAGRGVGRPCQMRWPAAPGGPGGARLAGMFARAVLGLALCASVIPQSVEQLTDKSTHVVRATVTQKVSAREAGPAGIYTRSTLQLSEALKGRAPAALILR